MKTDESVLDFPKDGLCPELWENVMSEDGAEEIWRLIPTKREKICNVAKMVCEEAGLDYNRINVYLTGSITSNTYTANADIDIHLHMLYRIREFAEMTQARIRDAFAKVKKHYDAEGLDGDQGLFVGSHPFEFYYQPDEYQDYMSIGCYDVKQNIWLVGPELKDPSYNPYSELYKDIQSKAGALIKDIRNKILDVYEKAVVFLKVHRSEPTNELPDDVVEIAQHAFSDLLTSIKSAVQLYENARAMRKVYSSPTSIEQALKFRSSKKWKIADAAFKLMDKFGYLAILKKYKELEELISTGDGELAVETAEAVLSTVKNYINNPEKLADSEKLKESICKLARKMRPIVESWQPKFDHMPTNQWGEKWQRLEENDWHVAYIRDIAKDCQIDIYEDGPKLERLHVNSVHLLSSGNLIVTVFGGANGGGLRGGCNLTYYLSLLRKFIGKLVDKVYFQDAWFIDWDNDCCDDCWTFRFVLKPTDSTKLDMLECGYELLQVKESIDQNECMRYVAEFKDALGYRDDYMPKSDISKLQDSLAHECALRLPTDTEAREIQGDAVIMLVMSGDDDAVKVGKQLGDVLIKNAKQGRDEGYEEQLLVLMSDAYKKLQKLEINKKSYVHEVEKIDEGANYMLTTAALVALLAIKNICPAVTLKAEIDNVPKTELRASSTAFKKAIAKATKGKSYNGMNLTNIINAVARTIYAEAKSEGKEGQDAVASVIWNRAGGKCSNLIPVISKKLHFSCWNKYTGGWNDKTYTIKIPSEAIQPGDKKDTWDYCMSLATRLAEEEFTSTIGNRNSYMNRKKASQKNIDAWGDKLDMKIGSQEFGYLPDNDGFKKASKQAKTTTYVVKAGDTLSKIAGIYKMTVDELAAKNNIQDRNKLKIGQKLVI